MSRHFIRPFGAFGSIKNVLQLTNVRTFFRVRYGVLQPDRCAFPLLYSERRRMESRLLDEFINPETDDCVNLKSG